MEKNILDATPNDLMALAVAIIGYLGNTYNANDLAVLSAFFDTIGDGLSIYAASLARSSLNNSNSNNTEKKKSKNAKKEK